ncbi:hypothetical protein BDY19DRAFT_913591 [Irpex rosettiformis]|uniref:Uncharacterized protein n=1 Tax=Irpex rosettiformis TaxID=378272 RepID=A0ACB8UJY8_9APHY|nr:hypothetical protein BDY19DRAFT_913591 [Irpex rosettiformis]
MSNGLFHCENSDFTVKSIPDGDIFNVRKECLTAGSEIFRDMFSCCDAGFDMVNTLIDEDSRTLELHEKAAVLDALFYLLHSTPAAFVNPPLLTEESQVDEDIVHVREGTISDVSIPWPLIPPLFVLADKYALSQEIVQVLKSHLAAYASVFPLQVYGCASGLGFHDVAADASTHLLHPPLATYTLEDVKVIPTAEAYHKLVLLHDFRVKKLAEVLRDEQVFPHGYGECSRLGHSQRTRSAWDARKQVIYGQMEAATNVAALMEPLVDEMAQCYYCRRACKAAVAMLAYKCAKVSRRVDEVNQP